MIIIIIIIMMCISSPCARASWRPGRLRRRPRQIRSWWPPCAASPAASRQLPRPPSSWKTPPRPQRCPGRNTLQKLPTLLLQKTVRSKLAAVAPRAAVHVAGHAPHPGQRHRHRLWEARNFGGAVFVSSAWLSRSQLSHKEAEPTRNVHACLTFRARMYLVEWHVTCI